MEFPGQETNVIRFGSLSALLIVLGFATLPHAQSQRPTFEVASVKKYTGSLGVDTTPGLFPRLLPGGVLRASNTRLIELIKLTNDVSEYQIAGGPGWISNDFPAALQEQLGLTLEASCDPIDVLAIDSVQQPTENWRNSSFMHFVHAKPSWSRPFSANPRSR
jgi:hypothetical protein